MIICDFCLHYRQDLKCQLGLNIPKGMTCGQFDASLKEFCSNPNDAVSADQIIKMATFFGVKRTELKKVRLMALREEKSFATRETPE
jgi:hypothetical protein